MATRWVEVRIQEPVNAVITITSAGQRRCTGPHGQSFAMLWRDCMLWLPCVEAAAEGAKATGGPGASKAVFIDTESEFR